MVKKSKVLEFMSRAKLAEEAFIEEYNQERIREFLKEDELSQAAKQKARRFLGS